VPIDARIPLGVISPQIDSPQQVQSTLVRMAEMQGQAQERQMRVEAMQQERSDVDATRQALSGSNGSLRDAAKKLMTVNPALAMQLHEKADLQERSKIDHDLKVIGYTAQLMQPVMSAQDPASAQAAWTAALTRMQQQGLATDGLPEQFDPQIAKQLHTQAFTAKDQLDALQKQIDDERAERIAKATEANFIADNERAERQAQTAAQNTAADNERQAATAAETARHNRVMEKRPTGSAGSGPGSLSPTMEANVINRLTTQWKAASSPAAELHRQSQLMDVGMAAARRGDKAQGAQVVLVTFQKILDPPSVVRESEYMRSAAGQSLVNRVKGYMEQLRDGGAGLTMPELEKFARLAKEASAAQSSGYLASQKERIGKTADRFKLPRDLIFEDFDFAAPTSAAPPPAAAPKKQKIGRFEVEVSD
jgi:hypothetical protein